MTEEEKKIIRNIEIRVHQLLLLCDNLREEKANLHTQLEEQKSRNDLLNKENSQLQFKYDNLKVAQMISVNRNDFKDTKNRLSDLVREVNTCISLLQKIG